ncbi:MAG: hypothetical protein ABI947_15825 [Chloroflexota bacterium]
MLTFVSGWKGIDRDQALINQRDKTRRAIFFMDNSTSFLDLVPHAPLIDLYRTGRLDFKIGNERDTLVRLNYDTDNDLITGAVTNALLNGADAQIIVTYDSVDKLYRIFPALRAAGALLAANERLEAPAGDRVLFTRGGSFRWPDRILETRTSLLTSDEVLDAGIVPDEDEF